MDQDEIWRAGSLVPCHIMLDGDPAPSPPKHHTPDFWPVSIVTTGWIRLPLGMEVGFGPATLCQMMTQLPS